MHGHAAELEPRQRFLKQLVPCACGKMPRSLYILLHGSKTVVLKL